MLNRIIDLSLRYRVVVLLLSLGIVVAGLIAFRRLPIDAFPDTTPVQVQINTNAPALSPLEIERQITAPVEQAISGLPHLEEVRSLTARVKVFTSPWCHGPRRSHCYHRPLSPE